MRILFLTGNPHKLKEAKTILEEHDVEERDLGLPEIQSLDPKEIIREKLDAGRRLLAEEARSVGQTEQDAALLVEDVSFWIGETGLPGPFIKFFNETLGREGNVRFARAFNADRARAQCEIGVLLPGMGEPEFFSGTVTGRIVDPRGESGFGFDPIFQPDGHAKTYAEMTDEEKNAISHRRKALTLVEERLSKGKF